MKELDLDIKKNEFKYKQVFENETVFVYAQYFGSKIIAYEAFYKSFGDWSWSKVYIKVE